MFAWLGSCVDITSRNAESDWYRPFSQVPITTVSPTPHAPLTWPLTGKSSRVPVLRSRSPTPVPPTSWMTASPPLPKPRTRAIAVWSGIVRMTSPFIFSSVSAGVGERLPSPELQTTIRSPMNPQAVPRTRSPVCRHNALPVSVSSSRTVGETYPATVLPYISSR